MLFFNDNVVIMILGGKGMKELTKVEINRLKRRWSRKDLANKAGLSDGVIRRIENGEAYKNATINSFYKIAKAFDMKLEDILDFNLLE